MTRYEYLEEIKEDLKNNHVICNYTDWESLYDEAFVDDAITGNASGSYYFNSYKAREAVAGAEDVAMEALECFGCDKKTILDHMFDYEWLDCTIRCYLLGEAIQELKEELEEEDEE